MASPSNDQTIIEQRDSWTSDTKRQVVLLTRVLKLDPDHSLAYFKLAINFLRQKQYPKAKKKWKKAIRMNPNRSQLYCGWFCALYDFREFEEVLLLSEKYPERFLNLVSYHKRIGMSFLHLGDSEKAIEYFECQGAYLNWAVALYLQGKQEEALEIYRRTEDKVDGTCKKEVGFLKEELKREESKGIEDLIKRKIEAFQYFIDLENEGTE